MVNIINEGMFNKHILADGAKAIVLFYEPNNRVCEEAIDALESVYDKTGFPSYTVNCTNLGTISEQFDISITPTAILFDSGYALCRSEGVISYDDLIEMTEIGSDE